jgi:hypothetical protein
MMAKIHTVSVGCYGVGPLLKQVFKFTIDIRKQEEVLQESYMMIPDSKSRLEKAVLDLANIVVR